MSFPLSRRSMRLSGVFYCLISNWRRKKFHKSPHFLSLTHGILFSTEEIYFNACSATKSVLWDFTHKFHLKFLISFNKFWFESFSFSPPVSKTARKSNNKIESFISTGAQRIWSSTMRDVEVQSSRNSSWTGRDERCEAINLSITQCSQR